MKLFHQEVDQCGVCPMMESFHSPITAGEYIELEKKGLEGLEYMKARTKLTQKAEIIQVCRVSGEAPPGRILRQLLDKDCDSPIEIPDWCPLPDVVV